MEKNNYIKALFKTFNVIHVIIIALFVMGMYFLSVNVNSILPELSNPNSFKYTIKGLYTIVLGSLAICYLIRIKSKEINLFDLFAWANLLGIIGALIYAKVASKVDGFSLTIAIIAILYLIGIVVRFFISKPEATNNQFKCYMYNITMKINPLIFAVIGFGLGIYASMYMSFTSKFYTNIENYFYAILIGIILLGAIMNIVSSSRVTIIDYVLISLLCLVGTMVIYSKDEVDLLYPFDKALFLAITTAFILYFRGLSFNGDYSMKSKIKDNNYHSAVLAKYDYALAFVYGTLAIVLIAMTNFNSLEFNYIIDKITVSSFDVSKHKIVFNIIGGVLLALPVILILVKRDLKNKNIVFTDYLLKVLEVISLLALPLTYLIIANARNLKMSGIIIGGIIIVMQIFTIVIYLLRIKHYEIKVEDVSEKETVVNVVNDTKETPVNDEIIETSENTEEVIESSNSETLDEALAETKEEALEEEKQESRSVEPVNFEESVDDEDNDEDDDLDELEEDDKEDASLPSSLVVSEKRIRLTFEEKTTLASDEVKNYYNEVKNYLIMYRAHARLSKKCESFRYKGLLAKVAFAGKTLKVNLAIDPKTLEGTKYHFKDRSDKKQYQLVPTQIKIKSDRGLKYFKELVDMMMEGREVKPKRRFETTDFTALLIPDGHAVLYTLGVTNDHLVDIMDVSNIPNDLPVDLVYHIPTINGDDIEGMKEENSIYLDTLCKHFNDGDIITLDILKKNNILTRGNMLRIKARGTLDKHFTIYADSFEANALAMLLCTGSKAVKLIRNRK